MQCPKCAQHMEVVVYAGIKVRRCIQCRGLWFSILDHEKLKLIKGSDSIDLGPRFVGKQYDEVDQIVCPKCSATMVRMVDKDHHHIWFEECPSCFGVFFDAGEFRDFSHESIMSTIRDLFTPERL